MRAAWKYQGTDIDYAKLAANGITWPYFDLRDPLLTPAYLDSVKAHDGIAGCGVYAVASWYPTLTPMLFADAVDAGLRAIGWKGNPPVCVDIEGVDLVDYTLRFLTRWRQLRPKRTTDLTIEGHKGGLFTASEAAYVAKRVRYVVPQCYNGAMTAEWDTYAMTCDLTAAGFPLAQVCPFYDAAHLPEWWGLPAGYAFTMERLP
jgi:hypothetical protein